MQIILPRMIKPLTAPKYLVEMRQFLWSVRTLSRATESQGAQHPQFLGPGMLSSECCQTHQAHRDEATCRERKAGS